MAHEPEMDRHRLIFMHIRETSVYVVICNIAGHCRSLCYVCLYIAKEPKWPSEICKDRKVQIQFGFVISDFGVYSRRMLKLFQC